MLRAPHLDEADGWRALRKMQPFMRSRTPLGLKWAELGNETSRDFFCTKLYYPSIQHPFFSWAFSTKIQWSEGQPRVVQKFPIGLTNARRQVGITSLLQPFFTRVNFTRRTGQHNCRRTTCYFRRPRFLYLVCRRMRGRIDP